MEKETKREINKYVEECFDSTWKYCIKKSNKKHAKDTYVKKMKKCKTKEQVKVKARFILTAYVKSLNEWHEEERELKYIPLFATWLNRNIED